MRVTSSRPVYAAWFGRPIFYLALIAVVSSGGAAAFGIPSESTSRILFIATLGLFLLIITLGSFYLPSGIFGRPLLRGAPTRPLIALTFDDGPCPQSTPAVLQVLRRHGIRATFFVIGERAARHPELIAALEKDGHQVENHSLRHSWATPFMPRGRLAKELFLTQKILREASPSGRMPRWFRPPIGILSPPIAAAARRAGLRLCGWSCKSRDGLRSTSVTQALDRLRAGLFSGAILLLHDAAERGDHIPIAAAVLEQLLPLCAARGLRPVSLDELVIEDAKFD